MSGRRGPRPGKVHPAPFAQILGHLAKADIILQVRDARAPGYTDPGRLVPMPAGRVLAVVLAKADLADPVATAGWLAALEAGGALARAVDQGSPAESGRILRALLEAARARVPARVGSGRDAPAEPTRVTVVGLPNVGKSTMINRILGRAAMRTGDRPGLTKGETWARVDEHLQLLDTPGVIEAMSRVIGAAGPDVHWPALLRLAPEGLVDPVEAAVRLLATLGDRLRGPIALGSPGEVEETLTRLAEHWNQRARGGVPDLHAAAVRLLQEVGHGAWGRISLELPAYL